MKWIAKITSGGRVTIPQEVRKRLGVRAGDRLAFEVDEKGVRITKDTDARVRQMDDAPATEVRRRRKKSRGRTPTLMNRGWGTRLRGFGLRNG
jgi:AbrB family looped-hinge helix DNA binding protein